VLPTGVALVVSHGITSFQSCELPVYQKKNANYKCPPCAMPGMMDLQPIATMRKPERDISFDLRSQ